MGAFAILLLAIVGGLVIAGRVGASLRKARVVVDETQTGLRIHKGVVSEVLKPGQYSTWLTTDRIELVDTREQSLQINGQEVLCRDLMPVKISLVTRYKVVDATLYRSADASPCTG